MTDKLLETFIRLTAQEDWGWWYSSTRLVMADYVEERGRAETAQRLRLLQNPTIETARYQAGIEIAQCNIRQWVLGEFLQDSVLARSLRFQLIMQNCVRSMAASFGAVGDTMTTALRNMGAFFKAVEEARTKEVVTSDDYPGPWSVDADPGNRLEFRKALEARNRKIDRWVRTQNRRRRG